MLWVKCVDLEQGATFCVILSIPQWMSCVQQPVWWWQHRIVCLLLCSALQWVFYAGWDLWKRSTVSKLLSTFCCPSVPRCDRASTMENSTDDYRIQSFDLDTQMLLKTALKGQRATAPPHLRPVSRRWPPPPKQPLSVSLPVRSQCSEPGQSFRHHRGPVSEGPGVQ